MLLIGLTGGIATGKTSVSNIFVKLGAHLIDADVIARDIVKPEKPAWREIVKIFGEAILNKNKEIDRKILGKLIFNDREKRRQLEAITHPKIIEEENRKVKELRKKFEKGIILLDAALLIEAGYYKRVDKLIVVYSNRQTQLKRLMERTGLNQEEAERRIDCQMPLEKKARLADYVIDSNKSLEEVESQVSNIYSELVFLL